MADNLLRNPGFEAGAYPFDPNGIVYIPKDWTFTFREGDRDRLPRQDLAWGRPNAGCLSPAQFPLREHPIFFQAGSQVVWKVWSGRSFPFYITLSQPQTLTPGARYRFTLQVNPDMVVQYAPEGKVFASDPEVGAVRLFARGDGQTQASDFVKVGPTLPNGQYTALTFDFTAQAAALEVGLEAYGLFSIENCCFFFDNFSLEEIAQPAPSLAAPDANLLVNGSFEEGRAYFADDEQRQATPAGWLLEARAGRPQSALLEKRAAAPADQARLFAIGEYCWRAGSAPPAAAFDVRLWQAVSGLPVGRTYRASALVLADFASGAESAEAALSVQVGLQTLGTGWQSATALGPGRYQRLELTFEVEAPEVTVSLELRTRAAAAGGWVVDLVSLEPIS